MEDQNTTIEKSIELYAEGLSLYKDCVKFLEKATRKIEVIKNPSNIVKNNSVSSEDITLFNESSE